MPPSTGVRSCGRRRGWRYLAAVLLLCLGPRASVATQELSAEDFRRSLGLQEYTLTYRSADGAEISYEAFSAAGRNGTAAGFRAEILPDQKLAVFVLVPPGEAAGGEEPEKLAVELGGKVPSPGLPDLAGELRDYADFGGRPVLLDFFFSICLPCVEEVPALNEFARDNTDIAVLAVTFDTADEARAFSARHGFSWPVIAGAQGFIDRVGVSVYPTMLLVSAQGTLLAWRGGGAGPGPEGAELTAGELKKWVGEALAAQRSMTSSLPASAATSLTNQDGP